MVRNAEFELPASGGRADASAQTDALHRIQRLLGRAQIQRASSAVTAWDEMFDELAQATVDYLKSSVVR